MSAARNGTLWILLVLQAVAIVWLGLAWWESRGEDDATATEREASATAQTPARTVRTLAATADRRPEGGPDAAEPDPTSPPIQPVAAPAGSVLFGTVTGARGTHPRQASIALQAGDGNRPVVQTSTRRDAPAYALPGLEPGAYTLRVRAAGFRAFEQSIDIPPRAEALRHDIALMPSWELRVAIVDTDGTPLQERLAELRKEQPLAYDVGPIAVATFERPPAVLPATDLRHPDVGVGSWHGQFEPGMGTRALPKRFTGSLELPSDEPLFVSAVLRTAVLATERVQAGQAEVTITVPFDRVLGSLTTLRLQVVDGESDAPVAGARVGLSDSQSSGMGRAVDAEGRIELRRQRPGLLNLDVQASDRVAPLFDVELAPGAEVDLGALRVYPPVEVKVHLVGPGTDGEVRMAVQCLDAPPHPALRMRSTHHGSARDSTWSARLAPGRYRIRAAGTNALGIVDIDTANLGPEPVRIDLRACAKIRVTPPADRRVQLHVRDAAGISHFRRWLSWSTAFDIDVPPGDYTFAVTSLGGDPGPSQPLPVGPEGAALDLR